MIHLDTNHLIMASVSGSIADQQLRAWLSVGESVKLSSIVWCEFLCGPVSAEQVRYVTILLPTPEPFLPQDAATAAEWFNRTGHRRGSLVDCMIAAIAHRAGARLATANLADFRRFVPFGLLLA